MEHSLCRKVAAFVTCCALLISAFSFTSLNADAASNSYTEQQVIVKNNYQTVDTFYGVPAKYVLGTSNTGDYSCAGYVSKFYSTIFGVTVWNINTVDDKPSVYSANKKAELKAVTTPQPGDIMQTKTYDHVAIVKDCQGDEVTLIEQNYKWTYNSNVLTVINRKVIRQRNYFYRLYLDGKAQSLKKDSTAPVISGMKASSVTGSGFTVNAKITDDSDVSKVVVAAYPEASGASAAKYETFTSPSSNFKYTVKTSDHNKKNGNYVVKFTAYDSSGNSVSKTLKTYVDTSAPVISSAKTDSISAKGFRVSFNTSDDNGIKKISVPVWTTKNGMDDIIYYQADQNDDAVSLMIPTEKHNNEDGEYTIKIKVWDNYNNLSTKTITTNVNPAKSVSLSESSVTLKKGTSKTITAKMTGKNLTDSVSWKSNNSSIATVSQGKITSRSLGKTSVVAYTTGGKAATCQVNVTADIAQADVTPVKKQTYNGFAVTPALNVSFEGNELKEGNDYTVKYNRNNEVGTAEAVITGIGNFTGSKTISFDIGFNNISGEKTEARSSSAIRLSWNNCLGADGYIVERYDTAKKKWTRIAKIKNTVYRDGDLKSSTNYKYRVKAYRTSGKTVIYSEYVQINTCTNPAKPSCNAVSKSKGTITVTTDKVTSVNGYEIYISDKGVSGTFKKCLTTTTNTCTIKKLDPSSLKFVKIRSYKNFDGKKIYSSYSDTKMLIVK